MFVSGRNEHVPAASSDLSQNLAAIVRLILSVVVNWKVALCSCNIAMQHLPFIEYLPIEDGDVP